MQSCLAIFNVAGDQMQSYLPIFKVAGDQMQSCLAIFKVAGDQMLYLTFDPMNSVSGEAGRTMWLKG